jgi:hypothetical protein
MANIKTVKLLPEVHRTDKNSRFLSSTLDQLVQKPELERINGFIGTKVTPTYSSTSDLYLSETSSVERKYNLDPALVVYNTSNNVRKVIALDDLNNEIKFLGGNTSNLDRLYRPEYYSYDPYIDWDKFVNYQEYFWLVTGPTTVEVTGQPKNSTSTYTVDLINNSFVVTPDGLTSNPLITLYRGNVYNFEILGQDNFYIKIDPSPGSSDLYPVNVVNNGTSTGVVTLTVDVNTPSTLFYGGNNQNLLGKIVIKNANEDTIINVEKDILGKKDYTSGNGLKLSNGMKIKFGGTVLPKEYQDKEFFVEGVGDYIRLINYNNLVAQSVIGKQFDDNFDANPFDAYPFDNFKNLPIAPEYITINRASKDLNPWSRYNRWVHKDIISISARFNNIEPVYPSDLRAQRPIIEFKPNIQLYNFGSFAIPNVDLIDNYTTDPFKFVDGSNGYWVDEVELQEGHLVIFNNASDLKVAGTVYKVKFLQVDNSPRLVLIKVLTPDVGASTSINLGNNSGRSYHFNGNRWKLSQLHKTLNEAPFFDVFDEFGDSYSNTEKHLSDFRGTKIFAYEKGKGKDDPYLGFPLSYKNSSGIGSFVFKNHFSNDSFTISDSEYATTATTVRVGIGFLKVNDERQPYYANVWRTAEEYQIPVYQFESLQDNTSTIQITSIDNPGTSNFTLDVLVNNNKLDSSDFKIVSTGTNSYINFVNTVTSNVLLKLYTDRPANNNGYYETPLNLTNNPLNGSVSKITLSEMSDHVLTMVNRDPEWSGEFPGVSNLRDLPFVGRFGSRLISNKNPFPFAQLFLGDIEHSLEKAVRKTAISYTEFKNSFYSSIESYADQLDPRTAVDKIIRQLNSNRNISSPFYNSDMLAVGERITRTYNIKNTRNVIYPLQESFDPTVLSFKSVLVYINGIQQCLTYDYEFLVAEGAVKILKQLNVDDVLEILYFSDTKGCFVAPTPTKLGLYPKFKPEKYLDTTFLDRPRYVIVGHDGSRFVAYNDYRDNIILEFERRIYNNIKANYNPDLFDINKVVPGAFRKTDYNNDEINSILQSDFTRWAGLFGLDYQTNKSFDEGNPFSFNYAETASVLTNERLTGNWRNLYRYFYDTDQPHLEPWKMLGFYEMPMWWESVYGPAPYTNGNELLWEDLEKGYVRGGETPGINPLYSRPGLTSIIPVNNSGMLVDPTVNLIKNSTAFNRRSSWSFGDHGPVENTWRTSSFYPFAIQRLMFLTRPTEYCSLLFDTSRMVKNLAGQWVYNDTDKFVNLKDVVLFNENGAQTSGYNVWIVETGLRRNESYINLLRNHIDNFTVNLFHKAGGFISKNKLNIIIDAVAPTSTDPGSLLPQENYILNLNTSNPVDAVSASGIVIQKADSQFVIKGYDQFKPYFTIFKPKRTASSTAITVGGVSESFVDWSYGSGTDESSLSLFETTTANAPTRNNFYQQGQIVRYNGKFYRVKVSHAAETNFDLTLYSSLPSLPIKGGATVQLATTFDKKETQIPYGTKFNSIQDVYDLIVGYGAWLTSKGFVFDTFNKELNITLDWNFSAKEFLYWTTQNWSNNNLITVSPFATQIKFSKNNVIVDALNDSLYDYTVLSADGSAFPVRNLSVSREDGVCTIEPVNTTNGIYFVYLRPVQKEHGMIFDNTTIFNDVIYDIETGYRQLRMKFVGFRTSNWNGDYFSPGFVYDSANIQDWRQFTDYQYGDVIKFNSKYYSAANKILGSLSFDVGQGWVLLDSKPEPDLIPNFDYKINQFLDFYSLDIDNFDVGQQKMAQHLTGYSPRVYMNNIITNPISQYKFYQGFIREKGTKSAVDKISKATINNQQGSINFVEEWAFRVGVYGSYSSFKEIELPLQEGTFIENPQIINLVKNIPAVRSNDLVYYADSDKFLLKPSDYNPKYSFSTNTSTFDDPGFLFPVAGYVRFDDVTSTAYNENSLLDIANNGDIKEGDTVWLGFKSNGDWDVLSYEDTDVRLVGVFVSAPASEITFTTSYFHNFSVGDLVSIVNFNNQVNGVYRISSIPQLNQFSVFSNLTTINNEPLLAPGLVYKFVSKRFSQFDEIPNDSKLLKLPYDTKFWIDENKNGKWEVYKKTENYTYNKLTSGRSPSAQQLGWSIMKKNNNNVLVVGAPGYQYYLDDGRVFVFDKQSTQANFKFSFTLNSDSEKFHDDSVVQTKFGQAIEYDPTEFNGTGYGLFFTGAPSVEYCYANQIGLTGIRYASPSGTTSTTAQEGAVKISSVNSILGREQSETVLLSPSLIDYENFGSAIVYNTSTKMLFVGAPGTINTNTGGVYIFHVNTQGAFTETNQTTVVAETTSLSIRYIGDKIELPLVYQSIDPHGVLFGSSISISDSDTWVVGAPGFNSQEGLVAVYSIGDTSPSQVIHPPESAQGPKNFGHKVLLSPDSSQLFVSAPLLRNSDLSSGAIYIYNFDTATGIFDTSSYRVLTNPVTESKLNFGQDFDYNVNDDALVVSSLGTAQPIFSFDKGNTTFDQKSTRFYNSVENFGEIYIYNRKSERYVLADQLKLKENFEGTNYGFSVKITDNEIFVGAPAYDTTGTSAVYQFNKIDPAVDSWDLYRQQDDIVDLEPFRKVYLFDSFKDEVSEYLNIIDPVKGKIAGEADQEIKFKSAYDPAVYSIGLAGTVVDTNTNWLDDHLGELWWDISTLKYVWYEQGDLSYRKNNWGQLFPGATIDVYEWVGSSLLPSEWSSQADTTAGLTNGISGQPKYPDNSVISVKQVYNSVTNSFGNYYYYWVKNKVLIPNVKNRRISAYQVATLIADPRSFGYKFVSFISSDALTIANSSGLVVGNRINLNISYDYLNNSIPRHTEWLLINEGSDTSMPTTRLNKKLIDSLLGHDDLGNLVPDPTLNERNKYGLGIRPQQTLFKNRFSALRNIVEYANGVLLKNQITGKRNFENLNSQEAPPDEYSREWDQTVEDNEALLLINTASLIQAELSCTMYEGKIRGIQIVNPGFGYKLPPKITVEKDRLAEVEAEIETEIDSLGRISKVTIINSGQGYSSAPLLEVRSYSVIVLADSLYNGKWTKFVWNSDRQEWVREKTQKYNTPLYWSYVDWTSPDYNPYQEVRFVVSDYYQIYEKNSAINPGDYIKVLNPGDNRPIILERTSKDVLGDYDQRYNLVLKEQGTIQISNSVWNIFNNNLGYDKNNTFDQTLYDQTLDVELKFMLNALKDDLFVNDLKVHWNILFFKAVKYALTEQPLLDWAFKTSFINVTNHAGSLDQRPVYKLGNSDYYQDYLAEVKPYRTQIRTFTVNHDVLEETRSFTTDFDLPPKFNFDTGEIVRVGENSSILSEYPWKSWSNNYLYEVGDVLIGEGGSNYVVPPVVIFTTAPGDSGSGAAGVAYISSGKVSKVVVTNPGTGYKTAPIISFYGGGYVDLIPARAYPLMKNNKVRSNTIQIKFDRISDKNEIGDSTVVDSFVCDGVTDQWTLSWLAQPDRSKIKVTIDGVFVLRSDFTIKEYTEDFNGYSKKYSAIQFLNYIPGIAKILRVEYEKSIDLYSAAERVLAYYKPTAGMPGKDLEQVMSGIEYSKTQIKTLGFDYTSKWDAQYEIDNVPVYYSPFGESVYADDVSFYTLLSTTSTGSVGTTNLILNSVDGIIVGQSVNISSTLTNKFSSSTVFVTAINPNTKTVSLSTSVAQTIFPGEDVEFWTRTTNYSILDTVYDSGYPGFTATNTGSALQFALGVNPEDIVLDGDGFFTPNTSYATEEFVPGESADSVGISVFTKSGVGAPLIYSGKQVVSADDAVTRLHVNYAPPNIYDSLIVTYNGQILLRTTQEFYARPLDSNFYYYDFILNEIRIYKRSVGGILGYSVITVGGEGIVDHGSVVVYNKADGQVDSLAYYGDIKSAYVTVDGQAVDTTSSYFTNIYYDLTYSNDFDKRASVKVHNLDPLTTSTIQAWFFDIEDPLFNEVQEQTFVYVNDAQATSAIIFRGPGSIEPYAPQVIVELSVNEGFNYRRLLPPFVSYYNIVNTSLLTYSINNTRNFYNLFTPANQGTGFTSNNVAVYVNGEQLARGIDYTVNADLPNMTNPTITLTDDILQAGDVLAILAKPDLGWEYDIIGSQIYLNTNAEIIPGITGYITNCVLKVITYTNHDQMLMRTERFVGNTFRRFRISRQVLNNNFIWVTLNNQPLVNKYDYILLNDGFTIQISDTIRVTDSDEVVITSFSTQTLGYDLLGYRIFNDIFGRSSFKRISKSNSTVLTQPLGANDTEIHVKDASVLTPPSKWRKQPGVINISGERIEFYQVDGNVLKQLRRATLGTGAAFYLVENTKVIDQGINQTVPFSEQVLVQNTLTTTATTYTISTVSNLVIGDGITISIGAQSTTIDVTAANLAALNALEIYNNSGSYDPSYDLNGDSVVDLLDVIGYQTLANGGSLEFTPSTSSNYSSLFVFNYPVPAVDQVAVYYGGRLLRKTDTYYHDTTISFDSHNFNVIGKIDQALSLSTVTTVALTLGNAYVVTATNQVWIYENSVETGAINGFVYKGINYLPPEFSITTATQQITLNIKDGIDPNIKLSVIKKQFARSSSWNDIVDSQTTLSLLNSTTVPARFLQARPAELPDTYYYGGPEALTDGGDPLTDINTGPLLGI